MAESSKVILCTGANQGLGFSIIEVTGLRDPSATYILTSRNLASGLEAAKNLKEIGVKATIEVLQLDVTDDQQIEAAVETVKSKYGKLDVLINNAGIATIDRKAYTDTHQSLSALREQYNVILNTNLTSVAVVTTAFLPLLRASPSPKVINITSGFASITVRLKAGSFPSRAAVYASSKVGMNGMTVQMQVAERDVPEDVPKIKYYVVQPGLLKTAFTGFREGARDPRDGAEVVTRLVMDEEGKYEKGMYWQFEKGEMLEVPW